MPPTSGIEVEISGGPCVRITGPAVDLVNEFFDEAQLELNPVLWSRAVAAATIYFIRCFGEHPWFNTQSRHLFVPFRELTYLGKQVAEGNPIDGHVFELGLQTVQKKKYQSVASPLDCRSLSHVYVTDPEALKLPEGYRIQRLIEEAKLTIIDGYE